MEIQKSDKEQEKMNIEKVLEEKGYLMTAPFGTKLSLEKNSLIKRTLIIEQ